MYKGLKILAVVPARGGSKGVPKKNIKELYGKPLIAWSIETGLASKYIDKVIVSTDSEEIAEVARAHKGEVPFLRPKELAEDLTPDPPVFEHCLNYLSIKENYAPDIIVHLRPTGPLRTSEEIDAAIELLAKYPDADSVRSVEEPPKPPYKMWRPEGEFLRPFIEIPGAKDTYNAPRQSLPKVYQTTADIGVLWLRTILEKKSVVGDKVLPFYLKRETVDIDNLFDFEIAELIFRKRYGK